MRRLCCLVLLIPLASAQSAGDATELLQRAQSVGENAKNWRAEVVKTSEIAGAGINLKSTVRTRISAEAPLKLNRQNSGDDQTVLVCDGVNFFYSGDGHSYYRGEAKVNPTCDYSLGKFYSLDYGLDGNPAIATVAGRDHVQLADGDRECLLVRAEWNGANARSVHTLCIDSSSAVILRDVQESEGRTGVRMAGTTVLTSFEINPTFQPSTFAISIPAGAVEAKPPR